MANSIIYSQSIQLACLKKDYNAIQFKDSNVLKTFNSSWNSKKRFSVLHLGDSHLQNENLPNKCRQLVQELMGDGGIGLVQPFSIVKTYDASFYKSTHRGIWEFSKSYILPPKLPLGVRGMTAKTLDEKATFKVLFKSPPSSQNCVLSVFFQNTDESYDPIFMADSIPAILISKSGDISKYKLPSKYSSIQFSLNKTNEKQNQFILYGMSLSNTEDVAAKWHNAGVGACQYKSVLFEEKYMEQATYLNPDFVIIDYGTNDFLYTNSIPDQLKYEIQQVISKVKKANPRASVILTSAQDMNYKKTNVTACKLFSEMIKTIAYENQCGFWDWYIISGGSHSMNTWQENKLTMNDGIHLNGKGSELKGTLLIEALKNTISYLKNSTENRELNYEYPKEIEPIKDDAISEIKQPINVISKTIKKTYYTVKSGDNLGQIAEKFNINIFVLKKQNKLRGNLIFPKQILLIK
jgi:LysM repeat protein